MMAGIQAPVALAARLLLAYIFVVEGWNKLAGYAGTVQYMESHGVSGFLLPIVILTELGGGVLIALGLFSRLAASALAGFCTLTALLFHADFANPNEVIEFNKDLAIAGGFLTIVAFGAGAWSIDPLPCWRGERPLHRGSWNG